MLIVLFVISLIGLIAGGIWFKNSCKQCYYGGCRTTDEYSIGAGATTVCSGLALFCTTIALICVAIFTVQTSYIPKQIEVLRTENTQMEADINTAIEKYCEHENKTFIELKPNEIQFAFTIYPELKADELVTNYIEVLKDNRNEIKQLELEYAKSSVYRWWLYFGK